MHYIFKAAQISNDGGIWQMTKTTNNFEQDIISLLFSGLVRLQF